MKCKGTDENITELHGLELQKYIKNHLKVIATNQDWSTLYECPDTGIRWLEEFPESSRHGGTSQLRKIPAG